MSNLCKFNNWNDCQFVNTTDCYWYSFQDAKDPPGGPSNQPSRGGDKETKPPIIATDYGRKPYQSKSYNEMMRRTPLRASFDVALQKKSEFEKPYQDDEYPEMQHWQPSPWDWDEDGYNPRVDPTLPPISPRDMEMGWLCSLNCDGRVGRCNNGGCTYAIGTCYAELVGIGSGGSWNVTGDPYIRVLTGRNNPSFRKTYGTLDSIEIYPDWDKIEESSTSLWGYYKWKTATFQVKYTDSEGNICRGTLTVHCCTTCDCPADPAFAYNTNNPATIARNTKIEIIVDSGCKDFSWAVTGTGVSFDNATTTEGSNHLNADNSACGVASITVTDNCGTEVTGKIRVTGVDSDWVYKGRSTATCSPYVGVTGKATYNIIDGDQKWQMVGSPTYGTFECCSLANSNCEWTLTSPAVEPPCGNSCECCIDQGCTTCGGASKTHWPAFDYYVWECV